MSTLDSALAYAEQGFRVFPCKPGAKEPACMWKDVATADPAKIAGMSWRGNIAIAPTYDILILDLDRKNGKDGFATLEMLAARYGQLPPCPRQRTPSGGEHLWFRLPHGVTVKNDASGRRIGEGIDIRTEGGYVVVAPSTIDGRDYKWLQGDPRQGLDIPMAPNWLVDLAAQDKCSPIEQPQHFATGQRNDTLTRLAGSMRRRGMSFEAIKAALLAENAERCAPPLPEKEVIAIARSVSGYAPSADIVLSRPACDWDEDIADAYGDPGGIVAVAQGIKDDAGLTNTERASLLKKAAKAAGVSIKVLRADISAPAAEGALLPVVYIVKSDFARSVDDAGRLLATIPNLYQRGGALVEAIPMPERRDVSIQDVSAPRLQYLLAQAARWRYGDGADGAPDTAVVAALMAQGHWPGVRPLAGVLRQPTIIPDGRLVGAGYCAGLMREGFFSDEQFPPFSGTGAEAVGELRRLLSDFPFESAEDEAGALAAILTAVLRPTLSTAPGFLFRAHAPGSGKTYLADLVAEFAGGHTVCSWPREETEVAKKLYSYLLDSKPAITFDNLRRAWESEALAIVLTQPTYSDRTLGASKAPEVSTATLILATGNNTRLGDDFHRRIVTVELDPQCEHPEERVFTADPVAEVQRNHGAWVMVALRAIAAWLEAGAPKAALRPINGFGQWTERVRQVVVWYGLPDPGLCLLHNRVVDTDRELLARVLELMAEAFGGEPLAWREILKATAAAAPMTAAGALRAALVEVAGERDDLINVRKLGNWAAANERTVAGGRRLVQCGSGRNGAVWSVETLSQAGNCEFRAKSCEFAA